MRVGITAALTAALVLGSPSIGISQAPATVGAPTSFTLPAPDSALQSALNQLLRQSPYRRLTSERRLSVALIDLTDPNRIRYAGVEDDRMRYAASLPKIGILAGLFDQVDKGRIRYTPQMRTRLERMIRNSDNKISSEMIRLVGFENIEATLRDPRHELYDRDRKGGIWVGRGYGSGLGLWRRDPMASVSHGATARQAARFFALVDRGELVSPWASAEMKSILGEPRIHHKFVKGLETGRPGSVIYRKSGTWQNHHADAALVERDGRKYVAVALLEAQTASGGAVLSSLILKLDDLVFAPAPARSAAQVR